MNQPESENQQSNQSNERWSRFFELKRSMNLRQVLFILGPICVLVISPGPHSPYSRWLVAVLIAWCLGWMTAGLIATARLAAWPCPACGRPFWPSVWFNWSRGRNCQACGLPRPKKWK
jgi:hypothetical protein